MGHCRLWNYCQILFFSSLLNLKIFLWVRRQGRWHLKYFVFLVSREPFLYPFLTKRICSLGSTCFCFRVDCFQKGLGVQQENWVAKVVSPEFAKKKKKSTKCIRSITYCWNLKISGHKKSVSQEALAGNGFANNFGHPIGGAGYRGVEGVLMSNSMKTFVTRCVECAKELYSSDNIVSDRQI